MQGEVAFVAALWIGGIAAGDPVISSLLLIAGVVIGIIAIAADPARSRMTKALSMMALVAFFGFSASVFWWRHLADQPKPEPLQAIVQLSDGSQPKIGVYAPFQRMFDLYQRELGKPKTGPVRSARSEGLGAYQASFDNGTIIWTQQSLSQFVLLREVDGRQRAIISGLM